MSSSLPLLCEICSITRFRQFNFLPTIIGHEIDNRALVEINEKINSVFSGQLNDDEKLSLGREILTTYEKMHDQEHRKEIIFISNDTQVIPDKVCYNLELDELSASISKIATIVFELGESEFRKLYSS